MDPQNHNPQYDPNNDQQDADTYSPPAGTSSESVSSISKSGERYPFKIENAPSYEKEKNSEMEPLYETPTDEPVDQKDEPLYPLPGKQDPLKTHIVDKSSEVPKLHHLANTHDKLTNKADLEEEEFIKEVETAHDHR